MGEPWEAVPPWPPAKVTLGGLLASANGPESSPQSVPHSYRGHDGYSGRPPRHGGRASEGVVVVAGLVRAPWSPAIGAFPSWR